MSSSGRASARGAQHGPREAVLLMAGAGTRMRHLTAGRSKLLLPVYDESLAARSGRWLADQGAERLVVVAAPADVEDLRPHLAPLEDRVELEFVLQHVPEGSAAALRAATPRLRGDTLVCLFADNVFLGDVGAESLWTLPGGADLRCFTSWCDEGLAEVAVVTRTAAGAPVLHRKPHHLRSGDALTGLLVVRRASFDRFRSTPSAVGEHDLLELVESSIRAGSVEFERLAGGWIDATSSGEALWRAGELVRAASLDRARRQRVVA